MVTKRLAEGGSLVAVLDYDVYKRLKTTINNYLPRKIFISAEYATDEAGRKVAKLWCAYPKIGELAVKKALGIPVER